MKKAIIAASFGTTYYEESAKTIGAVEEKIKNNYPSYDVFRAYTSKTVKRKLSKRNIHIDNLAEALEKTSSYDEVIIQPTHIIMGYEYDSICNNAKGCTVGLPLLGSDEDYKKVADFLNNTFPYKEDSCVFIVAHGTEHSANKSYSRLNSLLRDDMFIYTIEGENDSAVLEKSSKYKNVLLTSLMLVCGDHAHNDIFGDSESVKSMLVSRGQTVTECRKGLGEYEEIQDIYLEHIKSII